jgi:hypothetical protein
MTSPRWRAKFISNWADDEETARLVLRVWADGELFDPRLSVTSGEDYDWLAIFNDCARPIAVPRERVMGFVMEPSWSLGWNRALPFFCGVVHCHDPAMFPDATNVVTTPSILPMHLLGTASRYLADDGFDKPRRLSMVVSALDGEHHYPLRRALVQRLLDSDLDFDLYGRDWSLTDRRYKGSPADKEVGLRDYRYSIAIENCSERGYSTEKIADCFLTNTVPIYYGCPDIEAIYAPGSIARFDPAAPDAAARIAEISAGDTAQYRQHVLESKRRYFLERNPYRVLLARVLAEAGG